MLMIFLPSSSSSLATWRPGAPGHCTQNRYTSFCCAAAKHIPANSAQQRKHTSMDNDDDFVNEDVNEDEYLSEDPDDDEEFDINAGNLPAFANAENGALSKALEDKGK